MAKHPTLTDARDEAGICEAAARFTWFEVHNGEDCPGKMIPTPQELAAWFPECPDGPKDETIPRLKAVFDHVIADRLRDPDTQYSLPENFRREISWTVLDQIKQYQLATVCLVIDPKNPLLPKVKVPGPFLYTLDILHRDWASMPDGERPQHPLTPIIRAWQIRPTATEPFLPKRRASLPSLQTIDHENITLPDFPGSDATAPVRQMALPGFEPAVTMCPSWLLWLYDRAGGESMTAGRGAPWDLHLFVSSFLHLGIDQRDGHWKTLRFPHLVEHEADWPEPGTPSVERWLFPDGWANKRRDWSKIGEALEQMRRELGYVPVNGGRIALVVPSAIPGSRDFPFIEFTIRVPPVAASGARLDWDTLRRYRLESATLYRAYLSAIAFLDRSARRGHGITSEIGAPVLKPDGKPKRRKGGSIIRSETNLIPNRHARYVQAMDDSDLTRLIGLNPDIRDHRYKARKAFERLHADGVIDLRMDRKEYRIFGPRKKPR